MSQNILLKKSFLEPFKNVKTFLSSWAVHTKRGAGLDWVHRLQFAEAWVRGLPGTKRSLAKWGEAYGMLRALISCARVDGTDPSNTTHS